MPTVGFLGDCGIACGSPGDRIQVADALCPSGAMGSVVAMDVRTKTTAEARTEPPAGLTGTRR